DEELPGVGLTGRRQEARDRLCAVRIDQCVELGGQTRRRLFALQLGEQLPALAQLGTQRALVVVDVLRHDFDSTGDRLGVMSPNIKAVIPAAGLGTRFLPATKA